MTPRMLRSVQVGLPRLHGAHRAADPVERPWTTGLSKEPVVGLVRVGRANLGGDGRADLVNDGGPEKPSASTVNSG